MKYVYHIVKLFVNTRLQFVLSGIHVFSYKKGMLA